MGKILNLDFLEGSLPYGFNFTFSKKEEDEEEEGKEEEREKRRKKGGKKEGRRKETHIGLIFLFSFL